MVDSIRFNGVRFSNSQHGNFSLVQVANRLDIYDSLIKLIQESIILDNATIAYNEDNEISIKLEGITTDYLANDAITTGKIQNNAVTTDKINTNAITTDKIDTDAVTVDKIQNYAVTVDKIQNYAVTVDKIQNDAVITDKIQNYSVTADKIQNYSITTDKINTNAVTKDKLNENILSTSIITNAENELIVAISDDTILENQDGLYVNPNYLVKKYETIIGNNRSRIFDITHNLNTKNIFVEVYEITSGLDVTNYTKQRINNNTVRLEFRTKPPTNGYVVNIIG